VAEVAYARDLAGLARPEDLRAHIEARMFWPEYVE
jgi:hypothetical protein